MFLLLSILIQSLSSLLLPNLCHVYSHINFSNLISHSVSLICTLTQFISSLLSLNLLHLYSRSISFISTFSQSPFSSLLSLNRSNPSYSHPIYHISNLTQSPSSFLSINLPHLYSQSISLKLSSPTQSHLTPSSSLLSFNLRSLDFSLKIFLSSLLLINLSFALRWLTTVLNTPAIHKKT